MTTRKDPAAEYAHAMTQVSGTSDWHHRAVSTHLKNAIGLTDEQITAGRAAWEASIAPPAALEIPATVDDDVLAFLRANSSLTDAEIRGAMDKAGVTVEQMARVTGVPLADVVERYDAAGKP